MSQSIGRTVGVSSGRAGERRRVGTQLDELARRIGALWGVEPHVSPSVREQLLADLAALDADVERLVLRSAGGAEVDVDDVRSCQQRYLWLRERWALTPEGRAA